MLIMVVSNKIFFQLLPLRISTLQLYCCQTEDITATFIEYLKSINYYFLSFAFTCYNYFSFQVTDCKRLSDNEYKMTVKTNAVALFVWLEVPKIIGHFSDNGFHMITHQMDLNFTSINPIDIDQRKFCKSVTITNLKSVLN